MTCSGTVTAAMEGMISDVPSIAGVMITRQGLRIYRDELVRRLDPREQPYYWIGSEPLAGEFVIPLPR